MSALLFVVLAVNIPQAPTPPQAPPVRAELVVKEAIGARPDSSPYIAPTAGAKPARFAPEVYYYYTPLRSRPSATIRRSGGGC